MLLILALACSVSLVVGDSCKLPSEKQVIDWDKFPDNWYESVTVNDALDMDNGCYLLRNVEKTSDGAKGLSIDYRNPPPYDVIHTHAILQESGGYLWDVRGKSEWMNHKFSSPEDQEAFEKEAENLFSEHAFYTDYTTYFIDLMCQDDGTKIIWFQSKIQKPTAVDILPAINRLKEIGEGWERVTLYPSACNFKDPFPGDL